MEEKLFTPKFNKMLLEFNNRGGCIEFKVFKADENEDKEQKYLHFLSAKKTIDNELLTEDNKQDFFNSGKRITLEKFFGNLVYMNEKRIILNGKNKKRNKFYFHNNEEEVVVDYLDGGLGYSFFQTPYTVKLKENIKEEGAFFFSFFEELFGDLNFIEVYKWSTDFSSYFDAGKEWWGTFYWTVYSFEKDQFIGIIASTSD